MCFQIQKSESTPLSLQSPSPHLSSHRPVQMAPPSTWTHAEVVALVDFLHEYRAEAGDGGNFKKTTFHRLTQHLVPFCTNGHVKDVKSCQNKWSAVRFFLFSLKRHCCKMSQMIEHVMCEGNIYIYDMVLNKKINIEDSL